jgi:fluoroacetyl-CoA thioesterase
VNGPHRAPAALPAGRSTVTAAVGEPDTALGIGDVAVLGTPRLVALAEAASVPALAGRLPGS